MSTATKTVLVTGDLVLDHHIYEGRRHHYADGVSAGVRWKPRAGGAALVHELLENLLAAEKPEWESRPAVKIPQMDLDFQNVDESQRAYAFWRPFPRDLPPEKQFWRVSEQMGFGSAAPTACCATWPPEDFPSNPKIIVLSEGGMGFRQTHGCWDRLPFDAARWVVLKTAAPMAEGELWEKLSANYSEKLVVIVAANELRKSTARLSSGLSWDETLESLLNELRPDQALASLTQCRHLIVTFESEGAVWIDLQNSAADSAASRSVHFVYDPTVVEGDHARDVEGTAFGFLSCLTAAVVWQLTQSEDDPDLETACEGGLCAMHDLRLKGHGSVLEDVSGFPAKRLAKAIQKPAWRYARARFEIDLTKGLGADWSLLRESLRVSEPAYDLARLTALRGPIALDNVPHLKIGKLLTADRREVESMRQLVQLMRRYDKHDAGKKPLSIGVFGPPGSGKSFAVQEIAMMLCGSDGWLEFNLSQFASPDDLIGAFHQIRDKVLQQRLPVVFFDEFDAQNYRWLQYLLAPMQDGKFQEGQVTHPIGKCIFIFAGGTSWTFETFGPPPSSAGASGGASSETVPAAIAATGESRKAELDFRLAKGPDFKSRLDAYLNVVGPNQRQTGTVASSGYDFKNDPTDIFFPIRRALMLRAELKCAPGAKLDIDEGVLHALLHAESFRHGSRSLSKLLQPFQSTATGRLVRSQLPPSAHIDMHTNAKAFLELCLTAPKRALTPATEAGSALLTADDPLDESQIEVLAPAVHDTFQRLGLKKGWLTTTTTFDELEKSDPFLAESNRAAARRMIRILDLIDLQLQEGENTDEERAAISRHIEFRLELMAEAEHDGWLKWHLEQGWRFAELPPGQSKDRAKKLHTCLIPYKQLKQVDQEKDRESIRNYLDFAKLAKKKIVTR